MKIALCYESMMPNRGGCETYLADLARSLVNDHHEVHLFTTRYDAQAFPQSVMYHLLPESSGLRFMKPWQFARACYQSLQQHTFEIFLQY